MIFASIGIWILAFITLFCASVSDKLWYKITINTTISALIAFLIYETWI